MTPPMGIHQKSCPYHTLIQLDSNEKFQINSNCYPIHQSVQKSWFTLPPLQEWYYKYRHPDYELMPSFKAGCMEEKNKIMDFIYPKGNATILIPKDLKGEKTSTIFHAVHKSENATLFWFLDDTFLGKTKSTHKIEVNPSKTGLRKIIIVDEKGNRIEKKVVFI
jgi:penicillin-binding protein 1C